MVEQVLQEIGLTPKEAQVYTCLLRTGGEGTTIEVAKHSVLPRTTVYDLLSSLCEKGLVVELRKGTTKTFSVETTHALFSYLSKQEEHIARSREKLKSVVTDLERLRNPALPVTSLRQFQGAEGIQRMLDEQIQETSDRDDTLNVMCNAQFFAQFQDYLREKSKSLLEKGYKVKVLVHSQEEDPVFIKIRNYEVKGTQQKYFFAAGMDIVGNFIGYWTEMDTLSGMLLENEQIARMQRAVFEQLWNIES